MAKKKECRVCSQAKGRAEVIQGSGIKAKSVECSALNSIKVYNSLKLI